MDRQSIHTKQLFAHVPQLMAKDTATDCWDLSVVEIQQVLKNLQIICRSWERNGDCELCDDVRFQHEEGKLLQAGCLRSCQFEQIGEEKDL